MSSFALLRGAVLPALALGLHVLCVPAAIAWAADPPGTAQGDTSAGAGPQAITPADSEGMAGGPVGDVQPVAATTAPAPQESAPGADQQPMAPSDPGSLCAEFPQMCVAQ